MTRPSLDGATWRRSSYSGENGTCVEVAFLPSLVGIRDSKDVGAGQLTVAVSRWRGFVDVARRDGFR
ncbi:hypothetical protein BLA60_30800 [Actinophytocola xinjiangensis]|uniref:DUF397 domain-containing protein n=1 Tax=Actinophytocola xinjiangensis TaxID=485602 RepID=A0A7Z0WH92_9PSEU|nr:DUF397 domain-containing protein [Actinophytocola xinjiangensis]OLF06657.1 hypothetical protein BLA60_30800 [Actinophytocola xinjiangensis]